jgi:hypothetical protein
MSELEIINTTNLLNHVSTIKSKYDDLAEYTGENYNVFNVLNIYSDELSHSAIIGNLLDAKGRHGQKDVFLKLFLEEIQGFDDKSVQFTTLHSFKTECSKVIIEKHVGKVNHENGEGGRIDILINDGQNNIIIENKVWAGDQNLQLIRYNTHDLNAPILYLTLDGKPPSEASIKHEVKTKKLTLGKEFICISYQKTIKNWLEQCIKEMANKPIIRESLNQYLVLVKQLTNQSTNNKMEKELHEIILNNYQASKEISNNFNKTILNFSNSIFLKIFEELEEFLKKENWVVFLKNEVLEEKSGGEFYAKPKNQIKDNWGIGIEGFNPLRKGNIFFGDKISIGVIGFHGIKDYYTNYLLIENTSRSDAWWNDYILLDNYENLETSFKNDKLIEYLSNKKNQDCFVQYVVSGFISYFRVHKDSFEKMINELQVEEI